MLSKRESSERGTMLLMTEAKGNRNYVMVRDGNRQDSIDTNAVFDCAYPTFSSEVSVLVPVNFIFCADCLW